MKDERIPLANEQKEIMQEFYSIAPTQVLFNKAERDKIWEQAKRRNSDIDLQNLKKICPAFEHQIRKSLESGKNIQSAVFSECVYAQTLANMLKLDYFVIHSEDPTFLPSRVQKLIESYSLVPRYVYSTKDKQRMLIQAGSCAGSDSALITVINLVIYTIEFKEPGARTSDPNLPKYSEDGKIKITNEFLKKYPQFEAMLNEKRDLNFLDNIGHNIDDFSKKSIKIAVSNNYAKKYADVICTEDINGYFVMMPTNQVHLWADLEGEIRPSGRNHSKVWTPNALRRVMSQYKPVITGETVKLEKDKLEVRKARGSNGKISGYKITPLFFIYTKKCKDDGKYISFNLNDVQQQIPSIAGKVFFKKLRYEEVKSYYHKLF